jgi:glycosyltransferase involved in cell wall biosynthesis
MAEPSPQVSVIVAAYKAERVIARAIRWALAQPEAGEVIVVVDASPDGTAAAARAADDGTGRLRVVEQPHNRGPAAARNMALGLCTCAWVTVLDDDDFMDPGRLARLLSLAKSVDFLADDLWLVDEGAEDGPRTAMWFTREAQPHMIGLRDFVEANCPHPKRPRRELGFLKPLMSRDFLYRNALFYDETMRLGEDYDLYARALSLGARFVLVGAQGYVAVRRPASLSARHGAKDLLALRASDDRLLANEDLSRLERKAIQHHRLTTDKRYQWQRLIDAVKAADPIEAASCFVSHPKTALHLVGNLAEQGAVRAGRALKRKPKTARVKRADTPRSAGASR